MSYIDQIQTLHLDILKEIGNIGAGHAATALSTLLNKKVDMKVPSVRVASFTEMMEMAGGPDQEVVSVSLRIEGEASGNMFFILSLEQAENYICNMTGDKQFSFQEVNREAIGYSAMQELGNILSGSYLSALSDFTRLQLYPSVPELTIDMFGAIISFGLVEASQYGDYAIVIDTVLKEEETGEKEEVKGHFFLLPSPFSFPTIFRALGVEMNE
ncbi:chemotaxis protein CheC [Bacillus sp. FJAT-42315]|uniref:chemotaxis protein CheC n=1 Tax=Bacillus sp. FJAT-42315 TaxID=2014077 RepID=UPI000BA9C942|nr:chemotaxis protein CheC [Bacillus sp. FJAT-42315]PAQ15904.1 CheY-P-specific phosphatase CheC [Bacillaceae bacterium SAOS 7]